MNINIETNDDNEKFLVLNDGVDLVELYNKFGHDVTKGQTQADNSKEFSCKEPSFFNDGKGFGDESAYNFVKSKEETVSETAESNEFLVTNATDVCCQ